MSRRDRVIGSEREFVAVGNWSIDVETTDRIWSIQNKDRKLRFRGFLEQVAEGRNVGVEARADVLNVVHERVEIFQLLWFGPPCLSVQRIDWQPRGVIFRIGNVFI